MKELAFEQSADATRSVRHAEVDPLRGICSEVEHHGV
jgi:hypothetical protein